MCTVTFWPTRRGYRLAMNRDEQLLRPAGLRPAPHTTAGRLSLRPSEPTGGSWITVNDGGAAVALINWYSVAWRPVGNVVSRGGVPVALQTADTAAEAHTELDRLPLDRIAPFRLIGVFPREGELREWRWDGADLRSLEHPWGPEHWASSGFDEPAAQAARRAVFLRAASQPGAGSPAWLRRLHADHGPARGPLSTCMHRSDAATVSYCEIEVDDAQAATTYADGPLCQAHPLHRSRIALAQGVALTART